MSIVPSLPGLDGLRRDIQVNRPTAERDSAEDFGGSQTHQTEVSVRVEIIVCGQQFLELRSTLVE